MSRQRIRWWEKEFDAKFPEYFDGAYYEKEDVNLGDELKEHIDGLLEAAEKRGRESLAKELHKCAFLLRTTGYEEFADRLTQMVDGLVKE